MDTVIRFAGKVVPGFALGSEAGDRFRSTANDLVRSIEGFVQGLTPREVTILRIGLEASHLEESVVHGDWTRAEAHVENLAKQLDQLGRR